jgi:bifunctional non-homologous end joining protein LigD
MRSLVGCPGARLSPRTRKALPTIEPIVPVTGTPLLYDPQWIYEPKFDGFRGVLYVSGRECYIRSKRGKVLSRFEDLALRVGAELHARDAILDGEVVALDDDGRMDFRALLASRGWRQSEVASSFSIIKKSASSQNPS